MSSGRLHGFDALRGIAALCVVMLHADAIYREVPPWFYRGYLGVDFFLMLSGYLMARITEPRIAGGASPWTFVKARYRRFWPVIALGSLLGIPYLWVRTQGDPAWFATAFVTNMVFLPWPADRLIFPLNVPVWTILAELLVNALHVFVLWRLANRHLIWLALTALTVSMAVAIDYGSLNVGARPENVGYAPPRVLLAYTLGMLLWRYSDSIPRMPLPGWLALIAMPGAMLASWASGFAYWSFDLVFVAVLCPIVIAAALNITRDTALGRFSGELSFPLFAAHVPAFEAARHFGFGPWIGFPAAIAAALAILWWTKRRARRMEPAQS